MNGTDGRAPDDVPATNTQTVILPIGMMVHYFNPVMRRCQAAIVEDRDPEHGRYSVCVLVPAVKQSPLAIMPVQSQVHGWVVVDGVEVEELQADATGHVDATLGRIHPMHV